MDTPVEANASCEDDEDLTSDDDIAALLCLFSIDDEKDFFSIELEAEANIEVAEDS